MAIQNKIDKAFEAILSEYADADECIGDLLSSIKCSDYDLTMEEAFVLNMKLRNHIDGDRFYRKTDEGNTEEFNIETEWFD